VGSSYECNKSLVVAKMISGRYRTEMLCRFWSTNANGYCEVDTCVQVQGDLEHLLVSCPALHHDRVRVYNLWLLKTAGIPPLQDVLYRMISAPPQEQVKFILDPSAHHEVIALVQFYGQPLLQHVMYLTRTLAFNMHRKKLILTGRWPNCGSKNLKPEKTTCNNAKYLTNTSNFAGRVNFIHQPPARTTQESSTSTSSTDHACTITTDHTIV
jgi:hypothetical protein